MCEIPASIILAEEFASRFDGFSIGSDDLTQLTLGIDRDSTELSDLFDERNEAVTRSIAELIKRAHALRHQSGLVWASTEQLSRVRGVPCGRGY